MCNESSHTEALAQFCIASTMEIIVMRSRQFHARRRGRAYLRVWLPFIFACAVLCTAAVLIWPQIPAALTGKSFENSTFRPVANDCTGGVVYFTFDDGPYLHTVA